MPAATMPTAVTTSGIVAQTSRNGATSPARGISRAIGPWNGIAPIRAATAPARTSAAPPIASGSSASGTLLPSRTAAPAISTTPAIGRDPQHLAADDGVRLVAGHGQQSDEAGDARECGRQRCVAGRHGERQRARSERDRSRERDRGHREPIAATRAAPGVDDHRKQRQPEGQDTAAREHEPQVAVHLDRGAAERRRAGWQEQRGNRRPGEPDRCDGTPEPGPAPEGQQRYRRP